jgi:pimeloyl-ACP methyl ester carboxylesterase
MAEETSTTIAGEGGVRLDARVFPAPTPGATGLLLHHGLASSQHIWDQMLPRLTRHFHVVTYDARGHGSSAKPNHGYGFDHVVADALAVADGAGLRRPVIAGHSWGAMVALEVAARHPSPVAGAVLIDGGLHRIRDDLGWAETKRRLSPPDLAGMPLEAFRSRMRRFLPDGLPVTPEVEAQVLSVMRVRPDGTIAPHLARSNHLRILRAIWEQDPLRLWEQVTVATLAILARDDGDAHRTERMRAAAEQVARRAGGRPVTIRWMRGVHDLPLQRPAALAGHIERFVRASVG